MTKAPMPEEHAPRYRRVKNVSSHLKRTGDMLSSLGEHDDAKTLMALEIKYRLTAMEMELRADIRRRKQRDD